MKKDFRTKWLEVVDKKNSVLCAGLDPAEFAMGRGEKGLPKNVVKLDWAKKYIDAVAPYCAALKPNTQYWKNHVGGDVRRIGDMDSLVELVSMAHARGMVVIEDSKLADIGSTNDAGVFYATKKQADAVTFSPFAGNMQEAVQQAYSRDLGLISMCMMSNPEYAIEKMKLVPLTKEQLEKYPKSSATMGKTIDGQFHTFQYIQLAHDANSYGADGIVIGAPSSKNHIKDHEIARICGNVSSNMLVLLPGVGAQGGEAGKIWEYFDKERVIVNVGRSLMLPEGSNSTPQQQAETAKHYRDMLNELRGK